MKDIDFLPEQFKEARRLHDRRVTGISLGAFVAFSLMLWYFQGNSKVNLTKEKVDYINQQYGTIQTGLDLIKKLKVERAQLIDKYELIKNLENKVSTLEILSIISSMVPPQITFKEYRLTCSEEKTESPAPNLLPNLPDNNTAKIVPRKQPEIKGYFVGLARNEVDVAVLVGQMTSCKKFQNIQLEYCKADTVSGYHATVFKICFSVKPDELEKT